MLGGVIMFFFLWVDCDKCFHGSMKTDIVIWSIFLVGYYLLSLCDMHGFVMWLCEHKPCYFLVTFVGIKLFILRYEGDVGFREETEIQVSSFLLWWDRKGWMSHLMASTRAKYSALMRVVSEFLLVKLWEVEEIGLKLRWKTTLIVLFCETDW